MTRRKSKPRLDELSEDELLDLRMCDLGLSIAGTWLEPLIDQIHRELGKRGLEPGVRFWLADEWFSPAGVPGVGVPFYLAHPRLMRLEHLAALE